MLEAHKLAPLHVADHHIERQASGRATVMIVRKGALAEVPVGGSQRKEPLSLKPRPAHRMQGGSKMQAGQKYHIQTAI